MKSKFAPLLLAALWSLTGIEVQATGLIIPVYGNTTAQFNAAVAAAQTVSTIAVINPDNGPGSSKIASVATQASRLKSAKAVVAGYISTAYGGIALNSVYTQIDRYASWYGATGIFLDETSDKSSKVSYYSSVYAYAKKKGMVVIGNPGTFTISNYAAIADLLITYEDPISAGWNSYKQPSWTNSYAPSKFGAIIYATSASAWKAAIDRAVSQRFGWVFVSDGSGADPFGRAPSYIAAEASYIKTK